VRPQRPRRKGRTRYAVGHAGAIPSGVHIQARFAPDGGQPRQLRILGDDQRGYLLAGYPEAAAESEDFWFCTLPEALGQAERLGVARSDWSEITAVDQVQMQ
jgi:hypothetical protein